MNAPTHRRFEAPASVVRLKGRAIATYRSKAFIPATLPQRRPPLVFSLLLALLFALVLCLTSVLLMHPVPGEISTSASAQTDESISALLDEYDP